RMVRWQRHRSLRPGPWRGPSKSFHLRSLILSARYRLAGAYSRSGLVLAGAELSGLMGAEHAARRNSNQRTVYFFFMADRRSPSRPAAASDLLPLWESLTICSWTETPFSLARAVSRPGCLIAFEIHFFLAISASLLHRAGAFLVAAAVALLVALLTQHDGDRLRPAFYLVAAAATQRP